MFHQSNAFKDPCPITQMASRQLRDLCRLHRLWNFGRLWLWDERGGLHLRTGNVGVNPGATKATLRIHLSTRPMPCGEGFSERRTPVWFVAEGKPTRNQSYFSGTIGST